MIELPDIPRTWIILALIICLVIMRIYGIDSWTTAAMGMIIGYLTGQHIEATAGYNQELPQEVVQKKD